MPLKQCDTDRFDLGMTVKRKGRFKIGEIVEMSGPGLMYSTVRWGDLFSDRVGKTSIVLTRELGEVLEVSRGSRGRARVLVKYCDEKTVIEEGPKKYRTRRKRALGLR